MRPATFVILTTQDAHITQVSVDVPQPVKKVVVKVAVAD
jgi:beta-galactosidase beta subunit